MGSGGTEPETQARVRTLRTLEVILGEFGLYFIGSENMFELWFLCTQYEKKNFHISSKGKGY